MQLMLTCILLNHELDIPDKDVIQNNLIELKKWHDDWLINLNIDKCKMV